MSPAASGVGTTYGFSLPLSLGPAPAPSRASMERESAEAAEEEEAEGLGGAHDDARDRHVAVGADASSAPVMAARPSQPADAPLAGAGDGDGDGAGAGASGRHGVLPSMTSPLKGGDTPPGADTSGAGTGAPGTAPAPHQTFQAALNLSLRGSNHELLLMDQSRHSISASAAEGGDQFLGQPLDFGASQGRRLSGQMTTRHSVEVATSRSQLSQLTMESATAGGGSGAARCPPTPARQFYT